MQDYSIYGNVIACAHKAYRSRGLTTTACYWSTKGINPFSSDDFLMCDVGLRDTVVGVGNVDSYSDTCRNKINVMNQQRKHTRAVL